MKISISAPLKSDEIIDLLNNYSDGGVRFVFLGRTGPLKLEFEVTGIGVDAACALAKDLIKNTSFGKVLYFSVHPES